MKSLGDYVHAKGLKFGLYLAVGLDPAAYNDGKTPIYNAPGCTTADIVYPDLRKTNGWTSAYQMDFSNPCSQKYMGAVPVRVLRWGDSRGFGICMAGRVSTFGGGSFAVGWTPDEGGWCRAVVDRRVGDQGECSPVAGRGVA
jgi:hypothetical protein